MCGRFGETPLQFVPVLILITFLELLRKIIFSATADRGLLNKRSINLLGYRRSRFIRKEDRIAADFNVGDIVAVLFKEVMETGFSR